MLLLGLYHCSGEHPAIESFIKTVNVLLLYYLFLFFFFFCSIKCRKERKEASSLCPLLS